MEDKLNKINELGYYMQFQQWKSGKGNWEIWVYKKGVDKYVYQEYSIETLSDCIDIVYQFAIQSVK